MKFFVVLILFSFTLAAQYPSFATTGDGSQIHFLTSLLLKSNPDSLAGTRLYRHNSVEPVLLRLPDPLTALGAPFLSTDGQTSGVIETRRCFGSCMSANPYRAILHLTRKGNEVRFENGFSFRLSRNGRYVLDVGLGTLAPGTRIYDLDTGIIYPQGPVFALSTYSAISNEGAFVSTGPSAVPAFGLPPERSIRLNTLGQPPRSIPMQDPVLSAALSADGRFVFAVTLNDENILHIVEISLPEATQRVIWEGKEEGERQSPWRSQVQPDLAGTRLLLNRPGTIDLWDRSSGEWRRISGPIEPDGTGQFTGFGILSDDGSAIVYSEGDNSLFRLRLATNESERLYAPVPSWLGNSSGSSLPGSLLQYFCSGCSSDMQVAAHGVTLPIVEANPGFFQVQVPWDFLSNPAVASAPQFSNGLTITKPDSPFLLRGNFFLQTRPIPILMTQDRPFHNINPEVAAQLQDFSGFVSQEKPAPAGSTIHLYLTGLGELDRPLKTLEPGPSDPPARPLAAIACYIRDRDSQGSVRGLVLPFVAYAPGLVGLYQVDATIPEDWPAGQQTISCANANGQGSPARLWTTR